MARAVSRVGVGARDSFACWVIMDGCCPPGDAGELQSKRSNAPAIRFSVRVRV